MGQEVRFTIDTNSPEAIYEQVKYYVQLEIASGRFHIDEPLPSIREIAETLNVNSHNVGMALRHLELMDILQTQRGRTARVTKNGLARCKKIVKERLRHNLQRALNHCKMGGCSDKEIRGLVTEVLKQNA